MDKVSQVTTVTAVNPISTVSTLNQQSQQNQQIAKKNTQQTQQVQPAESIAYDTYKSPMLKEAYVSLLEDNTEYLISHVYKNMNRVPYDKPEVRVGLSLQMLFSTGGVQLPSDLATKVAKDISDLINDDSYLSNYKNKDKKKKMLRHELERLRNHTSIDDTISLNVDNSDLRSSISTIVAGKPSLVDNLNDNNCSIS